jgi:hypothetical protein
MMSRPFSRLMDTNYLCLAATALEVQALMGAVGRKAKRLMVCYSRGLEALKI